MSEYIPKYPSQEGDDSNKSSSELLAETLKPIYVPQDLMLAWETHLASYSRDTHELLDQVKDSETALNTQYQALLTRVQKYEQMLQDITMDSNEFTIDDDEVNFTGWNILSQASYWDYLLRKEITKLSGQIKSAEYKGELVTEVTDAVLEGLIADNNYISNVIGALSDTPLIRELDEALTSTTTSLSELQAEYVRLAEKQAADAEALAHQQVENAEQLVESINTAVAEQLDRIAQEAAVRTQLLQEIEVRTNEIEQEALERSEAIAEHLGVVIGEVTQNVGAITDRIDSEVAVRTQMIADQAKALVLESEARAAAISTQADALAAESLARRNALTAQAEAITLEVTNRTKALKDQQEALSNKILSTNESTLAAIETRAVDLASDYNTKVTNLNNQLTSSIEDLETGVTTRLNSLDDEDGKLLQNIEAYKTSNNGNVAGIRSELTTLTTAHGTTATKVEGLTASFTGLDGKVSKNTSSIASEATARSNADSALGTRIDNLTASTSGKFTEVNSSITDVSEAVTSLEQATATRFTGLESSISSVDDKADTAISSAASAQNTANTAVTTNTAQAEEISKLQGRLDTTEGDLLTKASADVVSGIITDVSNIEGELSVQATSIEDLSANLLLVDAKAGTANTAAADAQTTANTAVTNNAATANRVDTLESDLTQVQGDLETKATASALELTNTEVTRLDGLTQTHSSSITDLSNELVTTNNNVTKALNAITIAETPTNQLPSWYWANHPMRIVNEVKTASVIGVTGLGTKVNLETRVYSTAQASGPIVQRVISATDPTLEMVRRSTSASAWSAWTQPLKAIKADIATKASSAALSSLDSKVTDIDGRVTSQATSISELEADLTETNNLLGTVKSTAASALDTANAAVTANDAQASDITQLQAKMATAEGTLSRKADANALSSLETKVDNNQTATATRIDELTAAITDLGEGVETAVDTHAFNALKAEVNTAKGNIASNTTAITDLGSSLNTLDNTVHGIEQQTTANANAIQDTSTKVSNIQGEVTSQGTAITNLRSDLTTAQNTADNAASLASTKADATAFNALDTKVTRIDGQVSSQASDITEIKADITDLDDKVDTKADSSALSALTTQVGKVDGKVTTNANALTTLGGRVSEVEGKVATKAEASALSDYYTKVQADKKSADIASGKVEEFSSNLQIGGENLAAGFEDGKIFSTTVFQGSKIQVTARPDLKDEMGSSSDPFEVVSTGGTSTLKTTPQYVAYKAAIVVLSFKIKNIGTTPLRINFNGLNSQVITKGGNLSSIAPDTVQEFEVKGRMRPDYTWAQFQLNADVPENDVKAVLADIQLEVGNKATSWKPPAYLTQQALDANSTAIQNTVAEVSRVDDRVTATNSAQSLLEGRVETVEGEVTKKADASALTSLSTRVDTEEGKSLSQGNAITALQNTINHATTGLASKASSTAVTAVDNKVTAANGRIDTTNSNVSKLTGRVSTVEGAVSTKAEASALTALTTRVSNAEGVNTSQGSAITTLENSVNHATTGLTSKASSAALTSVDNKVTAANGRIDTTNSNVSTLSGRVSTVEGDVAKKADASALTALTTRVGNAEGVNTSQGSAITSLQNSVNHATTGLATKASTSALTATNSEVSRVNGLVTGHTNQLTQLASDITSINGTLATKANASALNDIYTKTQTDDKAAEIAAGEVAKYDARLVIGGTNHYPSTSDKWLSKTFGGWQAYLNDMPIGVNESINNGDTITWSGTIISEKNEAGLMAHFYKANGAYIQMQANFIPAGVIGKVVGTAVVPEGVIGVRLALRHSTGDAPTSLFKYKGLKVEKGTKATAWSPSPEDVQTQLDANATAITNTNTEVERVDGRVTTESNRTTTLTGRVSTVEGNISKKADASALSSLDTRVGTVEGKYTSQASDITRLNNSLDTTNVNVGTAQTAAQNAMNAAGAKGKVIFGSSAPATADRLSQNLWIDTTSNANTPKRWNGAAWVAVTDKVATDAAKAVKDLDATVKTKADVSALNSLTTKVTDEAKKTTANTNSITTLNSDIVKINNDIATKANASALSDMYTKNEVDDKAAEIAAGEVSKYDASLVIGGVNLLADSDKFRLGVNVSGLGRELLPDGSLKLTGSGSTYAYWTATSTDAGYVGINIGETYTVSLWFKAVDVTKLPTAMPHFYIADGNWYQDTFIVIGDLAQGREVRYVQQRTAKVALTTLGIPHLHLYEGSLGGGLILTKWQLERGNKGTEWKPSNSDITNGINANATAINTTNTEVARVDGRVTTESNRITSLTGRVSTVEGAVSTKADASALNSLTTRVATEEGKSTSQGSAITSLQNTINHATTGLSTKASSAALTAVDNKVTAVDGRVTTTNSNVTNLTGRVSTVEGGLTTKADVSAVNALTTRVGNVEGGVSTQAADMTALKSSLGLYVLPTDKDSSQQNKWARITLRKTQPYISNSVVPDYSYIGTYPEHSEGYFAEGATTTLPIDNSINYYRTLINVAAASTINLGNLMGDDAHAIYVDGKEVYRKTAFSINACSFAVTAGDHVVDIVVNNGTGGAGFSSTITMSSQVTSMYAPKLTGVLIGNKAEASAIQTTNTEVSRINRVVSGHTTQLSNLTASIAGKADTSALNALTVRVEDEEGKSSTQASSITNLSSKLNVVSKGVITKEEVFDLTGLDTTKYYPVLFTLTGANMTRMRVGTTLSPSANGKPTWSTHASGFSCMFDWESNGSGWGAIPVTRTINVAVYEYTSNSQPPVIGISQFTNSSNECVYLRGGAKYTVGYADGASNVRLVTSSITLINQVIAPLTYSAELKVTTSLNSKASASAVSTLDTKVTTIDGKVTTQASQITTLTSDNTANKNALQVQAKVVDGVKANYMVKMETNGVIGGFGLMQSTGVLGQVSTSFGVNADSFFIGAPVGGKKPFMVTTANQVVDGITYPAGTYINTALIANATIGTAKIADAAITNAKIVDATIESAKIKSIKADKIEIGNPLVGPITPSMVTGTSLTNAANLFNSSPAANASFATYGTGTQSATSGAESKYIQVDVGSTVTMPEVIFFFRGSAGRKTYIKLKASVDGINWDYIMGSTSKWETIDDMPPAPGNDYSIVTIQASFSWYGVKPYRYLRLYGNGSSASATNELVAIIGNASGTVTKIGSEGILTGSITADKIQVDSLSAISANLGTIQVGSANIATGAITTAKIDDAAITSAKIRDLQVDTLKIKDEAVTVGVAAQGVPSLSIATNGGKVNVNFGLGVSFAISTQTTQTLHLRIMRGGVEIKRFSINSMSKGNSSEVFRLLQSLPPIVDNPVAGVHVYKLQYTVTAFNNSVSSFSDITASTDIKSQDISVSLSEVKK